MQFSQAGCWRSHCKLGDVAWGFVPWAYAFDKLDTIEGCGFECALLAQKMERMSQTPSGHLGHWLLDLAASGCLRGFRKSFNTGSHRYRRNRLKFPSRPGCHEIGKTQPTRDILTCDRLKSRINRFNVQNAI